MFNIRIDFEKSYDSYLFDKKSKTYFLDFFSFFSSLPLGYNHQIFQEKTFINAIRRICSIKVANNAMETEEFNEFLDTFSKHKDMIMFQFFHFCCTGALAVESALKVAIDYKKSKNPIFISFKGSFHGINSWGLVTDRFRPVDLRLNACPRLNWPKVKSIEEIEKFIDKNGANNIAAIIIEPVQATFGDRYFLPNLFIKLRELCTKNNICLIFDEIQTGFGTSGKMWYFQHLDIEPDIVVFGKKTQVSGIMVKEKFGDTFKNPVRRLKVTFDGDLIDMIRCTYTLKAYNKYKILENVNKRSDELFGELKKIKSLKNLRRQGLLFAFDLASESSKKHFFESCFKNKLLVSPASYNCIRLRPNLNVSSSEIQKASKIIKNSL